MSVWRHKRGGWYLGVRLPGGRREQIYLGMLDPDGAAYIDARVSELVKKRPLGLPISIETELWVRNLEDSGLLRSLIELGAIDRKHPQNDLTLEEWCDKYLESRSDYSSGTKKGWNTAKKHMISAFSGVKMREINAFQAETFARDLLKKASSEHASKIVERANQLFEAGIRAKILSENPFSDVKISGKPDKARAFYLDAEASDAVLDSCPHEHAAALFCLARWCGLRVPHEPLALKWSHVDLNSQRLSVPELTKTGSRVLPLFPKAFKAMAALKSQGYGPEERVFGRALKSAGTTWRSWLLSAIEKANLQPWPKLWHNLRASCRTDLEEHFESHVCDAWLGHSLRVAKDHYLMVKPTDWQKAMDLNV